MPEQAAIWEFNTLTRPGNVEEIQDALAEFCFVYDRVPDAVRFQLSIAVGEVGAEHLNDVAGQVQKVGVGADLGQIHRHPHRVGRLGGANRRSQEEAQIDRVDVGNWKVRSLPNGPLGHQDCSSYERVDADPLCRTDADQVLGLLAGKSTRRGRYANRLGANASRVAFRRW